MIATFFLPATVLRSAGEWPCTSALGLRTRRYSAARSKLSPLSKTTVSVLRSLCSRNSAGQGFCASSFMLATLAKSSGPGLRSRGRAEQVRQARRSIAGRAVAEPVIGLPLGRRVDVEVDHADAALLEHVDALGDRRRRVGRAGDRADTDRALRLGELGDARDRILHAQS